MSDFPKPEISFHKTGNDHSHCLFSIIIPSWNNIELLKLCIESIERNSSYKHQVIIHVNEGVDGTLDWVKQNNFDYTYSSKNAGVCYSVNAMAQLASTNYILYINDDMYLCKDWDKHLWDMKMQLGHDHFYLSGTLIEPEFTGNPAVIAPYHFGQSRLSFKEKELEEFASQMNHYNWSGSSWPPALVSKKLFLEVGGYSEEFSPGLGSDPDFAMKLWNAGVRDFIGVGKSLVYHFLSKSTGRVKKNNGRKQFAKKWGYPPSFFYKNVLRMGSRYDESNKLSFNKNLDYVVARLKGFYISLK